jgi:glycosyltransferase involved in cell wall biosynthesis
VPHTTIVVPCYNEAARLDLAAFRLFLDTPLSSGVRLLLVDDGSGDATLTVLHTLATERPDQIGVLALERNQGKAEAVRLGMLEAMQQGSFVGFWDADLATPLEAIPDFLAILEAEPEVQWVFGARVGLLGRHIQRRMRRHYSGRAFATCVSLVLDLPVYDTQCGAKLFRIDPALHAVLERPFRSRWIFDVEMIARLKVLIASGGGPPLAHRIYELPLMRWTDVAGSKVRGRDFIRAVRELAAIWWWLRRARR